MCSDSGGDRPDARLAARAVFVLAASFLTMLVGTGSIHLVVVALKPITAEFDWPRAVLSTAFALQYFGGGVGGILMGAWLDRWGMIGPALLGAVMIGLGAMLTARIDAQWQIYLIYGLMMGLFGRGTLNAPHMANITRWFDRRRGMAVGIVFSGQALGGVLWPPLFDRAIETVGWRETSFWYGVLALVVMLFCAMPMVRRPPEPAEPENPAEPAEPAVPSPFPAKSLQVSLSTAIIGCCISMSMPLAHIVAWVSDLGYSSARGAEMLSVILLSAAISSFAGVGPFAERYGGLPTLLAFSLLQALMLALFAVVDNLIALYVVSALFGFGYGGILPSYPVIVREFMPAAESGRRTGVVLMFAGVGMAVGAWFGGIVFDTVGSYAPAFLFGAAFNVLNLAIIGVLVYHARQHTRTPA